MFVQTGEVTETSAVVNLRCNSEMNSEVTVLLDKVSGRGMSFMDLQLEQAFALDVDDFTASIPVTGLSANTQYQYRVMCAAMDGSHVHMSNRATFWTAPSKDEAVPVQFLWAADLAGQGWGRNPEYVPLIALSLHKVYVF